MSEDYFAKINKPPNGLLLNIVYYFGLALTMPLAPFQRIESMITIN